MKYRSPIFMLRMNSHDGNFVISNPLKLCETKTIAEVSICATRVGDPD